MFTRCPKCGVEHKVDLVSLIVEQDDDSASDILVSTMYCEVCSKKHLPMFEHGDRLQDIADRFGVHLGKVQQIVRSGIDHDVSFEACLVGARLALSKATGKQELFSLADVATALGCTQEDAAAELEAMGISIFKITTLPGFEWLMSEM